MSLISNVMIVAAVAVFSVALRTYSHASLRRIGTLGIFATSFLAGWLIGGSVWLGLLFASTWLMLPWLEILTRVRKLRLPIERRLEPSPPPSRSDFPNLGELTSSIEDAGFEQLDDFGWSTEAQTQFYRLFYQSESRIEAAICLVEQDGMSFFFVSVSSRTHDGKVYMTWNYPFSYGLRLVPSLHLQRVDSAVEFQELVEKHREFLDDQSLMPDGISEQTPDSIRIHIEADLKHQIKHNLDLGLLARVGSDEIRYSTRGMFFLWFQFLRDLVRLS